MFPLPSPEVEDAYLWLWHHCQKRDAAKVNKCIELLRMLRQSDRQISRALLDCHCDDAGALTTEQSTLFWVLQAVMLPDCRLSPIARHWCRQVTSKHLERCLHRAQPEPGGAGSTSLDAAWQFL